MMMMEISPNPYNETPEDEDDDDGGDDDDTKLLT